MSIVLIGFVRFFMSSQLQEEIEDEIEIEQETDFISKRASYVQEISNAWEYQGEISRKIDVRPSQTKF